MTKSIPVAVGTGADEKTTQAITKVAGLPRPQSNQDTAQAPQGEGSVTKTGAGASDAGSAKTEQPAMHSSKPKSRDTSQASDQFGAGEGIETVTKTEVASFVQQFRVCKQMMLDAKSIYGVKDLSLSDVQIPPLIIQSLKPGVRVRHKLAMLDTMHGVSHFVEKYGEEELITQSSVAVLSLKRDLESRLKPWPKSKWDVPGDDLRLMVGVYTHGFLAKKSVEDIFVDEQLLLFDKDEPKFSELKKRLQVTISALWQIEHIENTGLVNRTSASRPALARGNPLSIASITSSPSPDDQKAAAAAREQAISLSKFALLGKAASEIQAVPEAPRPRVNSAPASSIAAPSPSPTDPLRIALKVLSTCVLKFGLPYDYTSIARLEAESRIKSVLNRGDIWHYLEELHQFVKQHGSLSKPDVKKRWSFLSQHDCRFLLDRINMFRCLRSEVFCNSIEYTEREICAVQRRVGDPLVGKGWLSPVHDVYLMDLVNRYGFVSENYIFSHRIFDTFKLKNGGVPDLDWVQQRIQWLLRHIIEGRSQRHPNLSAYPHGMGQNANAGHGRGPPASARAGTHPPTYSTSSRIGW